jgi:hypothetical protein
LSQKRGFQWGEGPATIIKKLRPNVFDVFVGNNGWNGWSRVERKNGNIEVTAGNQLDQRSINYLKARLL